MGVRHRPPRYGVEPIMSNDRLKKKARDYAAQHGVSYVEARRVLLERRDVGNELPDGITWVEDPNHPNTVRTFTIQQQERPDGVLPYEIVVDERGFVRNQRLWKGKPFRLVGFVDDAASRDVTLPPDLFYENPKTAVGKHPVFADRGGAYGTWRGQVETVTTGRTKAMPAHAVTGVARLTGQTRSLVVGFGHLLIHLADAEIRTLRDSGWTARNDAAAAILKMLNDDDDDQPFDDRPWLDLLADFIEYQAWDDLVLELDTTEAERWLTTNRPDLARG